MVADKVGRSSVVYRVGLFQGDGDEAAAEGRFVHVYVDNTDPARPVVPMPDEIRARGRPRCCVGADWRRACGRDTWCVTRSEGSACSSS